MGLVNVKKEWFWPGLRLPYRIDASLAEKRPIVMAAIELWNASPFVRLVPRTAERDSVVFQHDPGGCSSSIGRRGGEQVILCAAAVSVWPPCQTEAQAATATVAHEIGHALGLHHEHQRPDRDDVVVIPEALSKNDQYTIRTEARDFARPIGPYDCCSIMGYGWQRTPPKTRSPCLGAAEPLAPSLPDVLALRTTLRLWTVHQGRLFRVDTFTGERAEVVAAFSGWSGPTAPLLGRLYGFRSGLLQEIDPGLDVATRVGSRTWTDVTAMAGLGDSLFVVAGSRLQRLPLALPDSPTFSVEDWGGRVTLAALGGDLFATQGDYLYRVDPKTGSRQALGKAAWTGATSMAALRGWLYIIQNDRLHRVSSQDGSWQVLGGPAWGGDTALAPLGDYLLAFQNSRLHAVDPQSGAWQVLGPAQWAGVRTATSFYEN